MPSDGMPSTQQGNEQSDNDAQASSSANQGGEESQQSGDPSAADNDPSSQSGGGEQANAEPEIASGEPSQKQNDNIDFSEEDPSSSSSSSQSTDAASSQSSASASSSGQQSDTSSSAGQEAQQQGEMSGSSGTDEEIIAQMEGELNESLSTYDGMIAREREYIQNRANQQGSEEEVAYVDQGELYDEAGSEGQSVAGGPSQGPESAGNPSRQGGQPSVPTGARQGDFEQKGQAIPPPADIPSGHDDDVVARQIREAALYEKDAALREKLWQEYRKYKNQSAKE